MNVACRRVDTIVFLVFFLPEAAPSQMPQQTVIINENIGIQPLASTSTSEYQIEIPTKSQPTTNPAWAEEFEIPWGIFPKRDMLSLLQEGVRPKSSARREMVRILADEISKIIKKPGKKALAQLIVKTYPSSFQDELEGSFVGTGYDSLQKQSQTRFDNLNRYSNDNTFKRKWEDFLVTEENIMLRPGPTQKMYLHDKYGCINYMPTDYPDGESEATQEEKKVLLQ